MTTALHIDDAYWLAGLTWRHSYGQAEKASIIRNGQSRHGATHMACFERRGIHEYGFFRPALAVKHSELRFLAPTVAAAFDTAACITCALNENAFWFLIIDKDGSIRPGTDLVLTPEALAERLPSFGLDESFRTVDLTEDDLVALLRSPVPYAISCRSITPHRWKAQILKTSMAMAALATGWEAWTIHQRHLREGDATRDWQAQQDRFAQARADALPNTPYPAVWLAACTAAVNRIRPVQFGWVEDGWKCADGRAILRFTRTAYATLWQHPDGIVTKNGEEIQVVSTMPPLPGRGERAQHPRADADLQLRGITQFYGGTVQMKIKPLPVAGTARVTSAAMAADLDWRPFEMDLRTAPAHVDWDRVSGLRLRAVESTANGYRISGDLHAR
ncbi:type 4b pilus protein PilO2 [Asaia bogorensis]|uniref:Pilin accessory protein (PilO) n=1 Tax=Asaia bogorensis NBRC 16594 TaxID=1231624 RepID=A0AAN4R5I2_9PROT|nr:type 4b pilus protein PilO2 [Asaia bogorensis]GBQ81498.1 hypothetical protein AA0311_2632 [Asaia bogorensis NBRC 16594]GEL54847.1 hypothetical protein ABO01nite_28540 [Asaia bogorensis NBRC 16594]